MTYPYLADLERISAHARNGRFAFLSVTRFPRASRILGAGRSWGSGGGGGFTVSSSWGLIAVDVSARIEFGTLSKFRTCDSHGMVSDNPVQCLIATSQHPSIG